MGGRGRRGRRGSGGDRNEPPGSSSSAAACGKGTNNLSINRYRKTIPALKIPRNVLTMSASSVREVWLDWLTASSVAFEYTLEGDALGTLDGLALARPLRHSDILFDPRAALYQNLFPSLVS